MPVLSGSGALLRGQLRATALGCRGSRTRGRAGCRGGAGGRGQRQVPRPPCDPQAEASPHAHLHPGATPGRVGPALPPHGLGVPESRTGRRSAPPWAAGSGESGLLVSPRCLSSDAPQSILWPPPPPSGAVWQRRRHCCPSATRRRPAAPSPPPAAPSPPLVPGPRLSSHRLGEGDPRCEFSGQVPASRPCLLPSCLS